MCRPNVHALTMGSDLRPLSARKGAKADRGECYKTPKTVIALLSENTLRLRQSGPAQESWKKKLPDVYTGSRLLCTTSRKREPKHGQLENSASNAMLIGYETRPYLADVGASVVSKRINSLPLALQSDALKSRSSTLLFLLQSTLISRKQLGNIFFTVEEVDFVQIMTSVCGAYQCARERLARNQEEE